MGEDNRTESPRLGFDAAELAWRRSGLGGSDAAAILGVSPWKSEYEVWADKTAPPDQPPPEREQSERMEWGLRLEPALRQWYADRFGAKPRKPPRLRHPRRRWQLGHPDGLTPEAVVEYKLSEYGHGFGEPGSADIPTQYKAQLWHYMDLAERREGHLIVLFGGSRAERYVLPWTDAIAAMREELAEWWHKHVELGEPPELDGSESAGRAIRARYPRDAGASLVALPHQYPILRDLLHARSRAKFYDTQADRLAQAVQAAMGDAAELHAPGVRITWKGSDVTRTDWKRYAESLETGLRAILDGSLPLSELPDLEVLRGLYQTTEARRTFRVTVNETDVPLLGGSNGD